MRRIMAWFFGEGFCPSCDGILHEHEAGHCECHRCGAMVDYAGCRWRFPRGEWRRLPGMAGISYEEDAA